VRARYPDREGLVECRGAQLFFEEYGQGDQTVFLIPPWQIVHSRIWKAQIPYLARHFRVITYDPPGNGRSDRPTTGFDHDTAAAQALAVLDATRTDRAALVCHSRSTWTGVLLAAEHPERVERLVLTACTVGDTPPRGAFHDVRARYEGWEKFNANYWREAFPDFLGFFGGEVSSEPHSTKQREDTVSWGLGTTPEILIATVDEAGCRTSPAELFARVRVPTLLIHGTDDRVIPISRAEHAHEAIAGSVFASFEGSGHAPLTRDPVRYNLLVRRFLAPEPAPPPPWRRARARPRRALFISSPIGLGHALRDVAIARALRLLRPDVEIQWLAQDPVTRVLETRGERIHPASRLLAGESAHFESEAGEHDLHAFRAWRNMDEILVANFMLVQELLEAEPYDLVVGDEAWDVDYFLHENPELKRTAFVWLTDFVGWVPTTMDAGEAALTADHNAEMIEQVARFPRVRDRALFVGQADDVVDVPFGPGLPSIREWTAAHFEFPGYIMPFEGSELHDRAALRARLGIRPGETLVVAAVGGTGVGRHLLGKVIAAFPDTFRLIPRLRFIVATGPRIDPASLPQHSGIDYRAFVPDLYELLTACDLAVVQGGLSTCMELTAAKRPFLYFPLRHHFEQNVHVPHRLARYGAGVRMDYHEIGPESLAYTIAETLKRPVSYRDVETGGAHRAAAFIAPLL